MSEQDSYKTLGVGSNAGLEAVKKAYRSKAKQLHPDVNTSVNAHEEFVELGSAYEYLVNKLSGKTLQQKNTDYSWKKTGRYASYSEWERAQRAYARQRAAEHAKMEYEAFKKTGYYKTMTVANKVMDIIGLITIIFFVAVFAVMLRIWQSWPGIIIYSVVAIVMIGAFYADVFRRFGLKDGQRDRF